MSSSWRLASVFPLAAMALKNRSVENCSTFLAFHQVVTVLVIMFFNIV